jgi:hypothetical protein
MLVGTSPGAGVLICGKYPEQLPFALWTHAAIQEQKAARRACEPNDAAMAAWLDIEYHCILARKG